MQIFNRVTNRIIPLSACLALACSSALLGLGGLGCGSSEEPTVEQAPVSLEIRLQETEMDSQMASPLASLLPKSFSAMFAPVKFDEVARILVDISVVSTQQPFYTNFELTKISANQWRGDVPLLPRNVQLKFDARALDATAAIAFSGETLATLTVSNQNVQIPLAARQDGQSFPMPRMFRIVYPETIYAGQEEQFSFTLLGNAGASIGFRISAAGSTTPAPAFSPASGTVTLTNTVADFMTVYTAPEVTVDTPIDYQVTITAAGGQSAVAITTNFRTTIKPRPANGPIVGGTRPSVLFNPVILSLTANGSSTPGAVDLVAEVSDDSAPAALSYQWSYAPNQSTATATFADDGHANPAVFQGYTVAHQGTISLAVTDENNGTTTLHYTLLPDQFADAIENGDVSGIKRMVSGDAHTCVLTGDDKVRCWGDNTYGQLGYGNALDVGANMTLLPHHAGDVPLPAADPVLQLVAGGNHTCVLLQSGLVNCWGRNQFGQLGYNRTDNLGDGEPVTSFGYVTLGDLATKIAAGGDHTCAILQSGAVRCWGYNFYGQLGRGNVANIGDNETVYSAGNLDFGAGVTVRDLALGGHHTCALLSSGAVRCFGYAMQGQLGYGNTAHLADNEPLASVANVALTGAVRKLVAGQSHTCALTEAGTLRCWGYGELGQLGQSHAGGLNWGDNSGETPSALPSDINTGARVTDVIAGNYHVCALSSDGKLKCWGSNASGQLGTGNTTNLGTPPAAGVNLDGVTPYRISAGTNHTCALRSNGTARCWGAGADGRLGRGNVTNNFTATGDSANVQIFTP